MFTDEIGIILKAGDGGNGKVSFFPGKHSGPDGGNGGRGGDLSVCTTNNLSNLNSFVGKKILQAENGKMGESRERTGANGKNLIVNLPVGSFLEDLETQEEIELLKENQEVLLCIGGKGGKGNAQLKSSSNTTPQIALPEEKGQSRHFKIVLKMIAQFGLIGLPNTGKSSLLNELTGTNVKVADYPFTTLEPNLGVYQNKVIADIPGLIEGAHKGRGLGINFLKHIEKVKLLLHCISAESNNVTGDYQTIMEELKNFNPVLSLKKQYILLTKSDLLDLTQLKKIVKQLKKINKNVLPISIIDNKSTEKLKGLLELEK